MDAYWRDCGKIVFCGLAFLLFKQCLPKCLSTLTYKINRTLNSTNNNKSAVDVYVSIATENYICWILVAFD